MIEVTNEKVGCSVDRQKKKKKEIIRLVVAPPRLEELGMSVIILVD